MVTEYGIWGGVWVWLGMGIPWKYSAKVGVDIIGGVPRTEGVATTGGVASNAPGADIPMGSGYV